MGSPTETVQTDNLEILYLELGARVVKYLISEN